MPTQKQMIPMASAHHTGAANFGMLTPAGSMAPVARQLPQGQLAIVGGSIAPAGGPGSAGPMMMQPQQATLQRGVPPAAASTMQAILELACACGCLKGEEHCCAGVPLSPASMRCFSGSTHLHASGAAAGPSAAAAVDESGIVRPADFFHSTAAASTGTDGDWSRIIIRGAASTTCSCASNGGFAWQRNCPHWWIQRASDVRAIRGYPTASKLEDSHPRNCLPQRLQRSTKDGSHPADSA